MILERNVKISVIMPVYNSQRTLVRAVGSVLKQTLQDIEIICVNDASTDDSLNILMQLQNISHGKLVVIDSEENLGAGGARNLALDVAKGEYIGFVDSDDYIAPLMYEALYDEAKKYDYDIVDSGFYKESEDLAIIYTSDELKGELDAYKRSELIVSGGYLWSKIFKKELFESPKLRMRKNAILEDADILTYLLLRAKSIGNVKEIFYFYADSCGSLSKENNNVKYYENVYNAMEAIYKKTHKFEFYKDVKMAVEYEIIQLYSYGVNICKSNIENIKCKKQYDDNRAFNDEAIIEIWNERLSNLVKLKKRIIEINLDDNKYVQNKMNKLDIEIMKSVEIDRENGYVKKK